jgi:predicted transcriptional regulator
MSEKKMTREEILLLGINASKQQPVDAIKLGKKLGLSERNLKQSLHLLTHGNCIKRLDDQYVEITQHGKSICTHLC